MEGNNGLLTAVVLLERAKSQLKVDSRAQLSRTQLTVINQYLSQAVDKIIKAEVEDSFIVGYLIDVTDVIKKLCEEDSFTETDLQQKTVICSKVCEALDRLYIKAGEYYENHDFEYSIRLEPVLIRVVDRCLQEGMTFGVEA